IENELFHYRAFYPILYSSVSGAQELFEATVGTDNRKMLQILAKLFGFISNVNHSSEFMKSDAFIERGKYYADHGISETMMRGFSSALVLTLRRTLGELFTISHVRAWGIFLDTISHALSNTIECGYSGAVLMVSANNV